MIIKDSVLRSRNLDSLSRLVCFCYLKITVSFAFKGNREKGWNDPPEFLHSTKDGSVSTPPKKTLLNQRVAHNFDGKVSKDTSSEESKLNEPPKMLAPPLCLAAPDSKQSEQLGSSEELMTIEQIKSILEAKVQILRESNVR